MLREQQTEERRKHVRIPCNLHDTRGHLIYNVSDGGLYCETHQPYSQHQEIVLDFFSAQFGAPISLVGTIVRVILLADDRFGYGVYLEGSKVDDIRDFKCFILYTSNNRPPEASRPLPLPQKHPSSRKRQWEVVVIGGGLAGLVATRDLRKAGRDVLLLEGDDEVGGRLRSRCMAGSAPPVDVGAQFYAEKAGIGNLIKELGMGDQIIPVSTKLAVWKREGEKVDYFPFDLKAPWRGLGKEVLGGLPGLVRGLLTYPDLFKLLPKAIATKISSVLHADLRYWVDLDHPDPKKTSGDWIRRAFGDKALNLMMGSVMYGFLFEHPDQTSAAIAKWFFPSLLGLELYTLKSGFGSLAKALGNEIRDVTQTETLVQRIDVEREGNICVTTSAGEIKANHVILAVPVCTVREKKLYEPRHPQERELIDNARFAPAVVVTILTRDRKWVDGRLENVYTLFTPLNDTSPIGCVSFESGKVGKLDKFDGGEIVQFYFRPEASHKMMYERDEEIVERTLKEAQYIFPGLSRDVVTASYVWKWRNALPQFPPGSVRTINRYLNYIQQCRPPVILAGDAVNFVGTDSARQSGVIASRIVLGSYLGGPLKGERAGNRSDGFMSAE